MKSLTRIEIIRLVPIPAIPASTHSSRLRDSRRRKRTGNLLLALQDLESESGRRVPGDMAVQEPCARVVGFEGDEEIAASWEEGDVSAGWVVEFHVYETVPVWGF